MDHTREQRIELMELWERLIQAGYRANLNFNYYDTSLSIFNGDDLKKLKKILGVSRIDKTTYDNDTAMSARAYLGQLRITIYPDGSVFNGCKLVEETVEVPEKVIPAEPEKVIPAHTEKIKKVKCGKNGDSTE